MHKFLINIFIPSPIPDRDRAFYHKLVRILSVFFNPIMIGIIFLILKINDLWFVHDEDFNRLLLGVSSNRVSQVSLPMMVLYVFIPNLLLLYNQQINSADYVLTYVCGFPDSFVVLYHIWRLGITFEGWRLILYVCYWGYALSSLFNLLKDMMNYGLDQLIAERMNGGDLRRVWENHGPLATVRSAVDTLSSMNLQQLIMHRNRLESDLKQVDEKIVSAL